MKVFAPGKLILSGEHATVYGSPALAMAVNRYAIATATNQLLPFISFNLADLSYKRKLTFNALDHLKNRIKEKYKRFVQGDFKIRDVLQKPMELAQFALSLFFEALNIKITHGIQIHIRSDIPIGCGMGSSAATILSIVHAIAKHLNIELTQDKFFQLSLTAEKIQHGYTSGLDLRVSMYGGCVYVKDNVIYPRSFPNLAMYLVNTGAPEVSTGECVTAVAHHFKNSSLINDFATITNDMDIALQENKIINIKDSITANHVLLNKIGVVPAKVQNFIKTIEGFSGAAKICGAGAVSGDNAGVVLVITENAAELQNLCQQYNYAIIPISCESRGVHVV